MQILDTIVDCQDNVLSVPLYHRGHLSLKTGTRVDACLIEVPPGAPESAMAEMVVSPIGFESWQHLWRINAVFRDKPGVVHKLFQILAEYDLNVLLAESGSVQNRQYHQVEVIADAKKRWLEHFGKDLEDLDEKAEISALERRVTAFCIEALAFRGAFPRVKVRRMKGLFNAWRNYAAAMLDPRMPNPHRSSTTVGDGKILVPKEFRQALGVDGAFRALIVSDTKDRLLRVFFPARQQHFTYVRVTHKDVPGAVAQITGRLASHFDILTSLIRIKYHGENNALEMLLHCPEYPNQDDDELREQIIGEVLSASADDLNLTLFYPSAGGEAGNDGSRPEPAPDLQISRKRPLPGISAGELAENTAAVLSTRLQRLRSRASSAKGPLYRQLRRRINHLDHLLDEEHERPGRIEVFISYPFDDGQLLFDILKPKLQAERWTVRDGRDPDGHRLFRDEILKRVGAADAFVGIWPDAGGATWLTWELGAAQALDVPTRLLISKDLREERWKVDPGQHHYFWQRDGDFTIEADKVVSSLRDLFRSARRQGSWGGLDAVPSE